MDAVSVVELKSEKCPRVCGADILELLAQKRSRSGRAKVLVVDVRTSEEYPFITSYKLMLVFSGIRTARKNIFTNTYCISQTNM